MTKRTAKIDEARVDEVKVDERKIAQRKIAQRKIAQRKITQPKIGRPRVTSANVARPKVTNAKIAQAKVSNAKIAKAKIAQAKVAQARVAKAKIIQDPKVRGEWAESVFMERASAQGLAVSKPWGDSKSYDFVVGHPGRFVGVQVKSTMAEVGGGYSCTVRKQGERYARGSFDFLAAYVIPEDVWYIVPAEKFQGMATLIVCSDSKEAKYEQYREAWDLLRNAADAGDASATSAEEIGAGGTGEKENGPGEAGLGEAGVKEEAWRPPASALERARGSMNYFREYMERGGAPLAKKDDEV